MLREAAAREGVPVNALVARIDEERIRAQVPPGLAGAIRLWLVANRPGLSLPEVILTEGAPGDG